MTQHPFRIVYDLTGCFYVGRAYIRNRRQWDGIKYGTAGGTSMQIFQEKRSIVGCQLYTPKRDLLLGNRTIRYGTSEKRNQGNAR